VATIPYEHIAELYVKTGRPEKAIEEYEKFKAKILKEKKKDDSGIYDFNISSIWKEMGQIYFDLEDFGKAENYWKEAITYVPSEDQIEIEEVDDPKIELKQMWQIVRDALYSNLACALYEQKKFDDSNKVSNELIHMENPLGIFSQSRYVTTKKI